MDDDNFCLVPRNINARFTFFEGFGFKELLMVLAGVFIGIIVYNILGIFLVPTSFRLVIFVIFPTSGFVLTRTNGRNPNTILDMLLGFKKFKNKQQEFHYVFGTGREKKDNDDSK